MLAQSNKRLEVLSSRDHNLLFCLYSLFSLQQMLHPCTEPSCLFPFQLTFQSNPLLFPHVNFLNLLIWQESFVDIGSCYSKYHKNEDRIVWKFKTSSSHTKSKDFVFLTCCPGAHCTIFAYEKHGVLENFHSHSLEIKGTFFCAKWKFASFYLNA